MEEAVMDCFRRAILALEGILPTEAMGNEAKAALKSLIEKGEIVELEPSELDRICPGPRYGLKGKKYPMSFKEVMDFRNYKEIGKKEETYSYDDYLKDIQ